MSHAYVLQCLQTFDISLIKLIIVVSLQKTFGNILLIGRLINSTSTIFLLSSINNTFQIKMISSI